MPLIFLTAGTWDYWRGWLFLALVVPFLPVLMWRLLDEEKLLARELPGYTEYMRRVKYRLVPHVW